MNGYIITAIIAYLAGALTVAFCVIADGNKDDSDYDTLRDYYDRGYEDGVRAQKGKEQHEEFRGNSEK